MNTSMIFKHIILIYGLLDQGKFINSCAVKHINNEFYECICVAQNDEENKDFGSLNLPQCILTCLTMTTCRYINYNEAAGQCNLGLGACQNLKPAPGFLIQEFGPHKDVCLFWESADEPGRVPVQMYDGL